MSHKLTAQLLFSFLNSNLGFPRSQKNDKALHRISKLIVTATLCYQPTLERQHDSAVFAIVFGKAGVPKLQQTKLKVSQIREDCFLATN